jgi:hypothetical protein
MNDETLRYTHRDSRKKTLFLSQEFLSIRDLSWEVVRGEGRRQNKFVFRKTSTRVCQRKDDATTTAESEGKQP